MTWLLGFFFQNRTGLVVTAFAVALGGLFAWHMVDKSSALRGAIAEYVADAELTAARIELAELKRRQATSDSARKRLQTEIEMAFAEAAAASRELELYVSTVEEHCIVQPDLAERLRHR